MHAHGATGTPTDSAMRYAVTLSSIAEMTSGCASA
jgi:hypothetical protein